MRISWPSSARGSRKLAGAGYAIPHWPAQWPGGGRSLAAQKVIYEELARADAPRLLLSFVSTYHAFATLHECGSAEQQARYLPRILEGEIWCQGFSEPGAGSDLAAIRTKAERRGDRLCGRRPEGLVNHGAICRSLPAAGTHVERRRQAGGDDLSADGHESAGSHRAPDPPDPGRRGICRNLPRRRGNTRSASGWARKARAGRWRRRRWQANAG